ERFASPVERCSRPPLSAATDDVSPQARARFTWLAAASRAERRDASRVSTRALTAPPWQECVPHGFASADVAVRSSVSLVLAGVPCADVERPAVKLATQAQDRAWSARI